MTEWEDIIDSIRLDEVLNDLGIDIVQIAKGEHWSSCPLPSHPGSDASPSWSINEDSLVYNCFVCGGGKLPKLVQEMENLDTWDDAVQWLIPYSDGDTSTDDGFQKQLERYLERATARPRRSRGEELPFYSPHILDGLADAPLELLAKWHIEDEETVKHHQIKYDEERRRYKPGKGEYVGEALVIPHFFGGKLVGYQERWLEDDKPKWLPKYTNSDDFPKRQTIYGWDDAVEEARRGTPVCVVESAMTRMRLWELGYPAVATFGASVTDEQIRLLRSLYGGVVLAFDNDPDFYDAKGVLRRGAGAVNLEKTADALTPYIPVEIFPPVAKEKGDLADIDSDEVHALYEARKAIFSALATHKRRTRSY